MTYTVLYGVPRSGAMHPAFRVTVRRATPRMTRWARARPARGDCHDAHGYESTPSGAPGCTRNVTSRAPRMCRLPRRTRICRPRTSRRCSHSCAGCHAPALITEHDKYALECVSCHASTDPLVSGAIAANDTSCAACHPGYAAAHDAAHDGVVDPDCAECHSSDVVALHARWVRRVSQPEPARRRDLPHLPRRQ